MVNAIQELDGYEKAVKGLVAELEALSKITQMLNQATAEVQTAHNAVLRVESEFQLLLESNESLTHEVKRLRPSDFVSEFNERLLDVSREIEERQDEITALVSASAGEAAVARKQFAALSKGLVTQGGELERATDDLRRLHVENDKDARERFYALSKKLRESVDELTEALMSATQQIVSSQEGNSQSIATTVASMDARLATIAKELNQLNEKATALATGQVNLHNLNTSMSATISDTHRQLEESAQKLTTAIESAANKGGRELVKVKRLAILAILLLLAILVSVWVTA